MPNALPPVEKRNPALPSNYGVDPADHEIDPNPLQLGYSDPLYNPQNLAPSVHAGEHPQGVSIITHAHAYAHTLTDMVKFRPRGPHVVAIARGLTHCDHDQLADELKVEPTSKSPEEYFDPPLNKIRAKKRAGVAAGFVELSMLTHAQPVAGPWADNPLMMKQLEAQGVVPSDIDIKPVRPFFPNPMPIDLRGPPRTLLCMPTCYT